MPFSDAWQASLRSKFSLRAMRANCHPTLQQKRGKVNRKIT
jgi:hypothetical protein